LQKNLVESEKNCTQTINLSKLILESQGQKEYNTKVQGGSVESTDGSHKNMHKF